MSLSRVETKKRAEQHKQSNKVQRKRLLWINLGLLAVIVVVVAVFLKGEDAIDAAKNGVASWFKTEQKEDATPDAATNGLPLEADKDNSDASTSSTAEPSQVTTPGEEEQTDLNEESGNSDEQDSLTEQGDEPTVTLAFVGDILQGEYVNTLLIEQGYNYPYEKALFSLSSADYTIGNLEMPITDNGVPAENKRFVFKGKPEALSGLVYAGIDVVTLANNHTLDQGLEALYDTMTHLDEHGIYHIGAGKDETEAFAPHIVEKNGIKIAYLAASWVLPVNEWKATPYAGGLAETYDTTRLVAAIEAAENEADIVVVYVHWGTEKSNTPEQNHIDASKRYIEAGADIVVGSHAHVLQGFGTYQDKWIAYNLGNFVFSAYPSGKQAETGVLNATCTKEAVCELSFIPMKTVVGQPTPLNDTNREPFFAYMESISLDGVKVDANGIIYKP